MNRDRALNILKEHGLKNTHQRQNILSFFENSDGYRTARDLIAHMRLSYESVSYDTIYRNLHLFTDLNILEKTTLQGEKQFRMTCSEDHHHHFICKDCGKTKALDHCPMDNLGKRLGNYLIEGHKFEIYGLCPLCQ